MDNQQGRSCDLGWLAGVIESEGSISYIKGKYYHTQGYRYSPFISVVNTDWDLLNNCVRIFNELGVGCHIHKRKTGNNPLTKRQTCQITVSGYKRVKKLLDQLGGYFRSNKRFRSSKLLDIINYRLSLKKNSPYTEKEENCWREMKEMYGTLRDYTPGSQYKCEDDIVRSAAKVAEVVRNEQPLPSVV